ncbi:hypothetical protein LJK88_26755 [Paenibacillus sp. P26]|nr:hypothetical protein LJK88_26755 [Paenibacillus sp. P26]
MSGKLDMIRRRFNRSAAGDYDAHANVQRAMAESLAELVIGHDVRNGMEVAKILEIGLRNRSVDPDAA